MNTEIQYQLEILHNGVIQVAIDTVYFKDDGNELTRERHRTTLVPGEFEEAESLLDEASLNIVYLKWTEQVIEKYQQIIESDQATEESGF